MRRFAFACLAIFLCQPVQAQEKKPAPIKVLDSPKDAVAMALADAGFLAEEDRRYALWIWSRSGEWEDVQAAALVMNYLSRAAQHAPLDKNAHPLTPMPPMYGLAGGKLLRVDLRSLADAQSDLDEILLLREELRNDPAFSRLLTRDTIELALRDRNLAEAIFGGAIPTRKVHTSDWHWDAKASGTWYDERTKTTYKGQWIDKGGFKEVSILDANSNVVRLNARHLSGQVLEQLQALTHSEVPIVEIGYAVTRLTSAIQGEGLFRDLYSGLYSRFIGLRKSKEKGVTDEDLLLNDLLVGGVVKVKAVDVFEKQRSDRKLAMFRSSVTGSPRDVQWIPTTTRGNGLSLAFITGDPSSRDVDVGAHPVLNLGRAKVKAREWLWKNAFGLDRAALTDAVNGTLQDRAPADVVIDREIPSPYAPELDGGIISCGRCHGRFEGWQPMTNDVAALFKSGLDVFGDINDHTRTLYDTAKRLRGQFQGDANFVLKQLRDDNAEAVLRITGPWAKSKGQTDVYKLAWNRISAIHAEYNYRLVDAQVALRELGVEVAKADAVKMFNLLVPVLKGQPGVVVGEDARLWQLRIGGSITRNDWNLAFEGAMLRRNENIGKLSKKEDKK